MGGGVEASNVSALQQQLLRELQQTVGSVCGEFQGALAKRAAQQKAQQQKQNVDEADFEGFDACCKRLMVYISANMATSPEFTQQMDRIILLYHSDAPERVLRSIATKNMWFHRRDALALPSGANDGTDDVKTAYEFATGSDHVESQASGNQVKTEAQGSASLSPMQPAAVEAKPKNPVAPSMPTPKRRAPAEPVSEPSAPKRPRPALQTNSQPAAASNNHSE